MDARLLFWPIVAVLALAGCGKSAPTSEVAPRQPQAERALANRLKYACSSKATYARLKQIVFDEAIRIRNADPVNLDTLSKHALIRVENPLVKSRDETLDVTVCTGRFVLQVPPGAERAFDGKRQLAADIEYAAQPAADGSGLVYRIKGAEPIIYRLAAFDLRSDTYRPAGTTPGVAAGPGAGPATEPAPVEPQPPGAPTRVPVPVTRNSAPPPLAPVPAARETRPRLAAAPSFRCSGRLSRSERLVCESDRLAALDREMSSLFYAALSRGGDGQRAALRRTRDRFLGYRERCGDEDCVAQAYLDRMDEIRDIAEGR